MAGEYLYAIAFYLTALVAVASALMVVWHKNPIVNALYLVLCFFAVAALYAMLQAHFLAAIQVLVYAGAVLVLFLMIVMLLDLTPEELGKAKPSVYKAAGGAAAFGMALAVVFVLLGIDFMNSPTKPGMSRAEHIAMLLEQLGEDTKSITGKNPPARVLTDRDQVRIATDILHSLSEKDTLELARSFEVKDPESGLMVKKFPDKFGKLSDADFQGKRRDMIYALSLSRDLRDINVAGKFPEYTDDDLRRLITAGGLGRLKYLTEFGTTMSVGKVMFSRYYLPFEAASILLLAAIVGVLVMARRAPSERGPQ